MIDPYDNNPDSGTERGLREDFWGMLTAGGSGGNWYIRNSSGQSFDQNMDDFKAFSSLWTWTAAATEFFNKHIPFWEMSERDGLTPNGRDYVMADPGEVYVIYLPYGQADNVQLDLEAYPDQSFDVFWYNPRTGGKPDRRRRGRGRRGPQPRRCPLECRQGLGAACSGGRSTLERRWRRSGR